MPFRKLKWKGLLKFIGPIFFIYLIIRVVDPKITADILLEIQPATAILSILFFPILIFTLTARWWMVCRWLEMGVPFTRLFQIHYISWFLSAVPFVGVLPLAKIIYLKEEGRSVGKTAVSITLDKLFDVLGQVFFSFFALIYFPEIFLKDTHLWILFAAGCITIFTVLIYWSKIWTKITDILKRYTGKKIQKMGENLENEFSELWPRFDLNFITKILAISVFLGLLRSLILYLLAISLNIAVSFILIIACRALIGIINVIPVSISGLGTRDAILLFALPLAGVSKEAAIALGFLAFLWTIGSKFSGVVFWFKHPLPTSGIRSIKDKLIP